MGEGTGLLFMEGAPGTQFRTETVFQSQDTDSKKKTKYEYKVYIEQVEIFPFLILSDSRNHLPLTQGRA